MTHRIRACAIEVEVCTPMCMPPIQHSCLTETYDLGFPARAEQHNGPDGNNPYQNGHNGQGSSGHHNKGHDSRVPRIFELCPPITLRPSLKKTPSEVIL
jgi:hypothetical protein